MLKKKKNEAGSSGKKKGLFGMLIGSLLVALALFGVLIGVEQNLMSSYEKEPVVLCKTDIPKGTKITEANAEKYFYIYEVDTALVDDECIKNMADLIGCVAERNLEAQMIVRKDDCTKEAAIYSKYKNPIEASITADDPGDIVSGTVRKGDYVDIAVVNKDTLAYEVMLKNVYVLDAFTSSGERVSAESDGTAATMLTVVEEKENLAKYYSAREIGNVIVTKLDK